MVKRPNPYVSRHLYRCVLRVLGAGVLGALKRDDAPAYGVLATICVQHCGFRMQHVNNRVWATRCLPV